MAAAVAANNQAVAAVGDSEDDTEKYNCCICMDLLFDPVVGSCGHDACCSCLTSWHGKQPAYKRLGPVNCPVCRKKFALSADDLNVCIRLRDTVEEQFPKRTAERRAEVKQQQDAAAARAAAGSDSDDDDYSLNAILARYRQQRAAQAAVGGGAGQPGAQPGGFAFGGPRYLPAPAAPQPPAQPAPAAAPLVPAPAARQALPSFFADIPWHNLFGAAPYAPAFGFGFGFGFDFGYGFGPGSAFRLPTPRFTEQPQPQSPPPLPAPLPPPPAQPRATFGYLAPSGPFGSLPRAQPAPPALNWQAPVANPAPANQAPANQVPASPAAWARNLPAGMPAQVPAGQNAAAAAATVQQQPAAAVPDFAAQLRAAFDAYSATPPPPVSAQYANHAAPGQIAQQQQQPAQVPRALPAPVAAAAPAQVAPLAPAVGVWAPAQPAAGAQGLVQPANAAAAPDYSHFSRQLRAAFDAYSATPPPSVSARYANQAAPGPRPAAAAVGAQQQRQRAGPMRVPTRLAAGSAAAATQPAPQLPTVRLPTAVPQMPSWPWPAAGASASAAAAAAGAGSSAASSSAAGAAAAAAAAAAGPPLSPRLPSFKAGWHVPRNEVPEAVERVGRHARPLGRQYIKDVTWASREAAANNPVKMIESRERRAHRPQAGN